MTSNGLGDHLTSFEISNLNFPGIRVYVASKGLLGYVGLASKQPLRSYDLRFAVSNLEYPVHLASKDLRGHSGLQMTSEVI